MPQNSKPSGGSRKLLIDQFQKRSSKAAGIAGRMAYWRKRYAWLCVTRGTTMAKRIADIAVSASLLVLLLPVMLAIGASIRFIDGGPILHATQRVGRWGREFRFIKFRSMIQEADQQVEKLRKQTVHRGDITFKMKKDPRVTAIGRFIRRTSLDEIPQLWSVLKGDMTLVGPRPSLPDEVAHYTLKQRRRLDVRPGLTCLWQIGGRSRVSFERQVELDVEYIQSQSLWIDLKILLKTIPTILMGRGAY